jgi:type II secretory pathway pseudopilin PulG
MSNVLIGIIGVILFIGLALAGALFLGPRFQESTNNSKAAAQIQAMQQIVNAIDMYRVQEQGVVPDGVEIGGTGSKQLTDGGYLKSVPKDASGRGATFVPVTSGQNRMLLIGLQSKAVCQAVLRQSGGNPESIPGSMDVNRAIGCYGSGTENEYLLTARL